MGLLVLFAVSLVVASIIVNAMQRMLMKFLGASGMLFSAKTKLIIIAIVALVITGLTRSIFGV